MREATSSSLAAYLPSDLAKVPHLVERGCDKVAFDLLRLLSEGEMRPADLRERLGVASRSYFTLRYLSPLVASGYVEMTDPSHPRSSMQAYRLHVPVAAGAQGVV